MTKVIPDTLQRPLPDFVIKFVTRTYPRRFSRIDMERHVNLLRSRIPYSVSLLHMYTYIYIYICAYIYI